MGADPSEADRARDKAMASDGQHYVHASREMPVEGMAMQQQSVPMTYTQPAQHPEMFMRETSPGGGYPGMPGPQLQLQMQPQPMHYAQQDQQYQTCMNCGGRRGGEYGMPAPQFQGQVHPQLRAQMQPRVQPQPQPQLQSLRALEQVERANARLFWKREIQDVWQNIDLNKHQLPLNSIKRIMKSDPEVKYVAAEAIDLVSEACEMFVLDLSRRSWAQTQWNNKCTLKRRHIASTAGEVDYFSFLQDMFP